MADSMAKRVLSKPTSNPAVVAAEVANFKAETSLLMARSRGEELENSLKALKLEEFTRTVSTFRNLDSNHRVYDISSDVTSQQADNCIGQLSVWSRESSTPITIKINSGGGGVTEGLALFDFIRSLAARDVSGNLLGPVYSHSKRATGVYITTIAFGVAASMAAVLLQAGNRRVVAPHAAILVHDIQTGVKGSLGQVFDDVKAADKWNTKLQTILTERAKISQAKLKMMVARKEYWMEPDDAKKYGLVDAIGYA